MNGLECTLKYADPVCAMARDIAHHCTFGRRDRLILCKDAKTRHMLALALLEWCGSQGWGCNEWSPGRFALRGATCIIDSTVRESHKNTDVVVMENHSG